MIKANIYRPQFSTVRPVQPVCSILRLPHFVHNHISLFIYIFMCVCVCAVCVCCVLWVVCIQYCLYIRVYNINISNHTVRFLVCVRVAQSNSPSMFRSLRFENRMCLSIILHYMAKRYNKNGPNTTRGQMMWPKIFQLYFSRHLLWHYIHIYYYVYKISYKEEMGRSQVSY